MSTHVFKRVVLNTIAQKFGISPMGRSTRGIPIFTLLPQRLAIL